MAWSDAQAYLSQHVARDSWDQGPAFSIRMTAELQLVVVQTPWVLDEIEAHMTAWKGELGPWLSRAERQRLSDS